MTTCDGKHPEQFCLAGVCIPVYVVRVRGWFGRTKRWTVAGYSNHRWHSTTDKSRTVAILKWRAETAGNVTMLAHRREARSAEQARRS